MTLVHLSMFSAMNFANSSGEFGSTATAPRSARRCWMNALDPPDWRDVADKFKAELFIESNVDRVELVADFDRCVFGCTNPRRGSPLPSEGLATAPNRVPLITANGRSLPALMCSIDSGTGLNITCTWPPSALMQGTRQFRKTYDSSQTNPGGYGRGGAALGAIPFEHCRIKET